MSKPFGFELIGHIDVDSGLVAVGDPCYTTGKDASSAVEDWGAYLNALKAIDMFMAPPLKEKEYGQPYQHKGASLVCETLWGDGSYPVYARFQEHYGKRKVAALYIDFDNMFEEDED